jgi:hypothetical protein
MKNTSIEAAREKEMGVRSSSSCFTLVFAGDVVRYELRSTIILCTMDVDDSFVTAQSSLPTREL